MSLHPFAGPETPSQPPLVTPSQPPPFRGRGSRLGRESETSGGAVPQRLPFGPLPLQGGGWEGVIVLPTSVTS
jgi:hypothetical protein